ncbi:hydrolase [Clostridia bacterium]|nr:hydrolase [Clostridia bacterium]
MDLKQIQKRLKKELDKERYIHTLSVMYTAASLAMAHGSNLQQAMYAGLLHDCAKCIPNAKKLTQCKELGIAITETEEQNPLLLHAKLGAYLAKEQYGIDDPEILHAIQVHTTGEPNMNLLDKIIFIADYIEPYRDRAPNLAETRKLAFLDLDQALFQIMEITLNYLKNGKGRGMIDPMTQETYQFIRERLT